MLLSNELLRLPEGDNDGDMGRWLSEFAGRLVLRAGSWYVSSKMVGMIRCDDLRPGR
jgi:hypothetical protein